MNDQAKYGTQPDRLQARYVTPPKKEWVGLTDEEAKSVWKQLNYDLNHGKFSSDDAERHVIVELCRAIEAKLKEKNT